MFIKYFICVIVAQINPILRNMPHSNLEEDIFLSCSIQQTFIINLFFPPLCQVAFSQEPVQENSSVCLLEFIFSVNLRKSLYFFPFQEKDILGIYFDFFPWAQTAWGCTIGTEFRVNQRRNKILSRNELRK